MRRLKPFLRRAKSRWRYLAAARAARAGLVDQMRAQPAGPLLDMGLVIPVWNDADGLARLLARVRKLGVASQIIVVDDGSDIPVPQMADVSLLRHEAPRGGGVARNAGLELVTAEYVLFFDADDLILPDLRVLQHDLAGHLDRGGMFDFCLFKHADSRVGQEPRWGQPDWDEVLWARAGHACGALAEVPPKALHVLAQTANYPWNKIYRTEFLRDHAIGCAATAVHQDIPLHWLGFLAASHVLVSDRICAWHHVQDGRARLTNRSGRERLQVFEALAPVVAEMARQKDIDWQASLTEFCEGLMHWVEGRIDPALRADFEEAKSAFMAQMAHDWKTAPAPRVGSAADIS